jgi:hypothetical protein
LAAARAFFNPHCHATLPTRSGRSSIALGRADFFLGCFSPAHHMKRIVATNKHRFAESLPPILLVIGLFWLRFTNLGYSDYQGDEIKALFLPEAGQSFTDFLLAQRKGPTQFVITYLMGFLDPSYQNQFLIRMPFAAASMLAAVIFYYFVKLHFGKKVALYAAFFFAFNGIIVALSRIVQYQSFVILFYSLALFSLTLAAKRSRWRIAGLYLGIFFWALSMLSHFDGIFIAPFVIYLLWQWYKAFPPAKTWAKWTHLFLSGSLVFLTLGAFYVPFFLNVSDSTMAYWFDRLNSDNNLISSSVVTFKVYNPRVVFSVYFVLFLVYLISTAIVLASSAAKQSRSAESFQMRITSLFVLLWFLFPWLYMEVLVDVPGTHIYTYLTPLTILISIGVVALEGLMKQILGDSYGRYLIAVSLSLLFLFSFYQSHKVFVDHTREYPWEEERFLFWKLSEPDVAYNLPLFGFPYYRHWEQIADTIITSENTGHYYSNEKETISRFYIPFDRNVDASGPYIHVENIQDIYQNWLQPKAVWWPEHHEPDKIYSSCDYGDFAWGGDVLYVFAPVNGDCANQKITAEIYYMTPGSLEDIIAAAE